MDTASSFKTSSIQIDRLSVQNTHNNALRVMHNRLCTSDSVRDADAKILSTPSLLICSKHAPQAKPLAFTLTTCCEDGSNNVNTGKPAIISLSVRRSTNFAHFVPPRPLLRHSIYGAVMAAKFLLNERPKLQKLRSDLSCLAVRGNSVTVPL
jgi:hypothetical protein